MYMQLYQMNTLFCDRMCKAMEMGKHNHSSTEMGQVGGIGDLGVLREAKPIII